MRDVTDNVTGELDVEVKRGRGRPRKEGALTNAQRQAAFRARRKAGGIAVTPKELLLRLQRPVVHQVDAYDECRLEVDTLRAELDHADKIIDRLTAELADARDALIAKGSELAAERKKRAAKSVTGRGNGIGLYAEIKKSSKYYGQTAPGELFAVRSLEKGEYAVQGGPGGQYRLRDVWLWSNGVRIG